MRFKLSPRALLAGILVFLAATGQGGSRAYASNLDTIGVTLLRAVTTNLNGAGIRVAQPEAPESTNLPAPFEVRPDASGVGQPEGLFTWASSAGSSSTYPNSVGAQSGHAIGVAGFFYGLPGGVATNVAHVDSYEANYFYNQVVSQVNVNDRVVNQSFIFGNVPVGDQQTIDSEFDDYAARYNTLFVSGAGNYNLLPMVTPPATCYNGIAVGASLGSVNYSSVGPTPDNGRAKPDITAPHNASSFSTAQVAGTAALLIQAALRGDGGNQTNAAADIRTIKALLLNGAIKPGNWTNGSASPLDARFGAGVVNVFNSYQQLAYGKHPWIVSSSVAVGSPHPPTGAAGTVSTLSGWDYSTNNSSSTLDGVNHYYFNVTNGSGDATFTATATLVWNRQRNETDINDLDLFLYETATSNLVAASTSAVDNVEHFFVKRLPPGRYDLQVFKNGGNTGKRVTNSETYALAFEFFNVSLDLAPADSSVEVSWPLYPAGFILESTTNPAVPSAWTTSLPAPAVTNSRNQVIFDATTGSRILRLRRP